LDALLDTTIRVREACMLAQVFGPRSHPERLDVSLGVGRIAVEFPSRCAIAPPDALVLVHGSHERRRPIRRHIVFDHHEHGTILELRLDTFHDHRRLPMYPWRQAGRTRRDTPEQPQRRSADRTQTAQEERRLNPRMLTHSAPECAAGGDPTLKDQHEHREHAERAAGRALGEQRQ